MIKEIICNICLEVKTDIKKNACNSIKCYTCQDGFICCDCIAEIDPKGSIFSNSRKYIEKAIKCPCCRQLNWHYQYNQIVGIILDDIEQLQYSENIKKPAIKKYLKNKRVYTNINWREQFDIIILNIYDNIDENIPAHFIFDYNYYNN